MLSEDPAKQPRDTRQDGDDALRRTLGDKATEILPLIERERSYIISLGKLGEHVKPLNTPSILISQRYFPRDLFGMAGALATELAHVELPFPMEISQARLRTSTASGQTSHFIQVKGIFPGLQIDERIEVSAKLSERLFAGLSKLAQAGFIAKRRFMLPGNILSDSGEPNLVVVEINLILSAGMVGSAPTPSFALIDVEVPTRSLYKQLIRGNHDMQILRDAVDISALDNSVKRLFSNKRLAAKGLDSAVEGAAKKLLRS